VVEFNYTVNSVDYKTGAVHLKRPDQIKFQEKVVALSHEYWIVRTKEEFIKLIEKEL